MKAVIALLSVSCFCAIGRPSAAQSSLLVDASRTKLRGVAGIVVNDVYPTFEIQIDTTGGEPFRDVLQYTGKQTFSVSSDQVVRISYNDLKKTDDFTLWPLREERGDQPISNPFTKFTLVSLTQIREEVKARLLTEVKRGAFAKADRLLKDVHDLYDSTDTDAANRAALWFSFHQLYHTASSASETYRMQPAFRTVRNRAELIEFERGWHRWMILHNRRLLERDGDETANVRLAYTLRAWANFARSLYTNDEVWPEESLKEAKEKNRISPAFEIALLEDLKLVHQTLLSAPIEPILTPKIEDNLSSKVLSPAEIHRLKCYQNLINGSKKKPGFPVEAFGLADTDRAVSAFSYFYNSK